MLYAVYSNLGLYEKTMLTIPRNAELLFKTTRYTEFLLNHCSRAPYSVV